MVGTQTLYGPKVLEIVEKRAKEMASFYDKQSSIPCKFVFKTLVKSDIECTEIIKKANYDDNCLGIVTFCHTFSPSKMWINGLKRLQKPWCHLATQHHKVIPNKEIDMDFMNLNQAAHGDREHGFIGARLRLARKIIAGYWQDKEVIKQLGQWARVAVAYQESQNLNVVRFGDNMRHVAVTEGDKIQAQIDLGWQVNTTAVYDLIQEMKTVSEADVNKLVNEYKKLYSINTKKTENIRYQAKEEIAIKRMLDRAKAKAFTNTFEDLCGLRQLPGLATQHLMYLGYGYGGEGDWKTAAMTRIIKKMTEGLKGGTSFMEDYSYNFTPGKQFSLGAHMLEVCPSLASSKPKIITNPLSIGKNPDDPARLVFEGKTGKGIVVTVVDMGARFRMIVQDIEVIKPPFAMPNLPVARVTWKPQPSLSEGVKLWVLAGGAHHTVLTLDANAEMLRDFAELMNMEFVHITKNSTYESLKTQLDLFDRQ